MKIIHCNIHDHAQAILDIFNYEIANTAAIYEYHPRTLKAMENWFSTRAANRFPVIGAVDDDGILMGFASYGTFRTQSAFKYAVEHSVYVHQDHRGKRIAVVLMEALIRIAIQQQLHVMVGAIDADNKPSIELHKKLGFMHAGTIRQAGFKFGQWRDFVFYQLILATPPNPSDG